MQSWRVAVTVGMTVGRRNGRCHVTLVWWLWQLGRSKFSEASLRTHASPISIIPQAS